MCGRCLRNVDNDDKVPEDDLSIVGTEDGDDNSLMEMQSLDNHQQYRSAVTIKVSLIKTIHHSADLIYYFLFYLFFMLKTMLLRGGV